MSLRRFVALGLAVGIGLGWADAASACSCVRVDRQTVIDREPIAFRGVVESARPSDDGRRVVASVRVVRTIKGRVPRVVTVTSTTIPGLCGYPLNPGADLVFAGRPNAAGAFDVGMCTMVPLNPSPRRMPPRR
ncbi:MAG: hypothetical protein GX458_19690 [Phyllobacteriaceae bacterium]|nr:hypothetical protein [Phyllobacteriaceae bacterium]